jgi:putative component of membrane protein insertase Oxa1/YidC/SpoIIIJ protein YidD
MAGAQDFESDMQRLNAAKENTFVVHKKKKRSYTDLTRAGNKGHVHRYNPVNLAFSGMLFFYQNVISSQLNAGCLYSPSCSEFSRQSIREFGLLKGIFLTADRMERCTRISALDLKSNKGADKIKDPAVFYRYRHK